MASGSGPSSVRGSSSGSESSARGASPSCSSAAEAIRSSQRAIADLGVGEGAVSVGLGAEGCSEAGALGVSGSAGAVSRSTSSMIFCWRLEPYSARISSKV